MNNNIKKKNIKKGVLPYFLMFLLMLGIVLFFNKLNTTTNILTYNEFMDALSKGKVESIDLTPSWEMFS